MTDFVLSHFEILWIHFRRTIRYLGDPQESIQVLFSLVVESIQWNPEMVEIMMSNLIIIVSCYCQFDAVRKSDVKDLGLEYLRLELALRRLYGSNWVQWAEMY